MIISHSSHSVRLLIILVAGVLSCTKENKGGVTPPIPTLETFKVNTTEVNNNTASLQYGVSLSPVIKLSFSAAFNRTTIATGIILSKSSAAVPLTATYLQGDSVVLLKPANPLAPLAKYILEVKTILTSQKNTALAAASTVSFITQIDSAIKFTVITDSALLDLVQQQTLKYFIDFAHPTSGLARERNTSGETVTSGGSGFGIMALITGVNRNFITRATGLAQMQKMVAFLKNTAQTFHGAYPHWLNGTTGAVIPFSANDNGADLVETSYLIQGLLCARQYFAGADAAEVALRADINIIWNRVEWNWFRQNNQNVLYWHWSPDKDWVMNFKIQGWNEALITYVLGASSTTFTIPKVAYTSGWAGAAGFTNGNTYLGYQLPLGPNLGGPLFFEHYSFMGINPNGLTDAYADYAKQTKNHTLINYAYCKSNPQNYYGYSDSVWGLTASDIPSGYSASSPTNDLGVIAPTAALSSFPYTPKESMQALKFYYYVLGDKLFKQYGFVDAFSLKDQWFANSFLAIDQGPIIVMIENYRTGLLWNLFTSCPEVKSGMQSLGFTAPYL
ncbi:MAG: glucoamylase family protein [Ferruginibacter sp.]